jgi:hypothetical protein
MHKKIKITCNNNTAPPSTQDNLQMYGTVCVHRTDETGASTHYTRCGSGSGRLRIILIDLHHSLDKKSSKWYFKTTVNGGSLNFDCQRNYFCLRVKFGDKIRKIETIFLFLHNYKLDSDLIRIKIGKSDLALKHYGAAALALLQCYILPLFQVPEVLGFETGSANTLLGYRLYPPLLNENKVFFHNNNFPFRPSVLVIFI